MYEHPQFAPYGCVLILPWPHLAAPHRWGLMVGGVQGRDRAVEGKQWAPPF